MGAVARQQPRARRCPGQSAGRSPYRAGYRRYAFGTQTRKRNPLFSGQSAQCSGYSVPRLGNPALRYVFAAPGYYFSASGNPVPVNPGTQWHLYCAHQYPDAASGSGGIYRPTLVAVKAWPATGSRSVSPPVRASRLSACQPGNEPQRVFCSRQYYRPLPHGL